MLRVEHIFPNGHRTFFSAIDVEYDRPVLKLNLGLAGVMHITHGYATVTDRRGRQSEYILEPYPA